MNRRKFVKQSVAAGVVVSRALRLNAGEVSAADPATEGERNVTLAAKPAPISLDLARTEKQFGWVSSSEAFIKALQITAPA